MSARCGTRPLLDAGFQEVECPSLRTTRGKLGLNLRNLREKLFFRNRNHVENLSCKCGNIFNRDVVIDEPNSFGKTLSYVRHIEPLGQLVLAREQCFNGGEESTDSTFLRHRCQCT